ncbi:MAG: rod shape-determining protein MreC [Planctomycetota bacterium]
MMSIRLRPRTRILLGCVAVFGPLLVPARHTSSFSISCVSLFEPVQRPLARGGRLLASSLDFLGSFGGAAAENRRLKQRITALTEEREVWRARAAEKDRTLATLGRFRRYQQALGPNQAVEVEEAEVIGEGAGARLGVLFVDRGSGDGIEKGMAVAAGRSVVGTVQAVSASVSSVLLVTSPASKLDGRVTSTGERGIVVGNGDGTMRMMYLSKAMPKNGDSVLTTGLGGVIPEHFVLGRVVSATRRSGTLTYDVTLRPLHDLDRLAGVVAVKPAFSPRDLPRDSNDGARRDDR